MRYVDFILTGDPSRAKETLVEALRAWGFQLAWADDWTATAEKGSRVANLFLGGFAQHFSFGLEIRSFEGGQSLVRVLTHKKGWWGGWIGVVRTRKQLRVVRDHLHSAFAGAGVLVSMSEG